MAADAAGNDITNVGIPITGFLAYAIEGTAIPNSAAGAAVPLALAEAFRKIGLIKEDGGFEWTEEPDGDPLAFYQDGYSMPTGKANVRLKFTAAEQSPITRQLRTGKTPDANGYLTVDGGGNTTRYVFFSEEKFKDGRMRRRAAIGRVLTAKLQKSERGVVQGIEFEIEIFRSPLFNDEHYGEWWIGSAPADPEEE